MTDLHRQLLKTAHTCRDACRAQLERLAAERDKPDSRWSIAQLDAAEAELRGAIAAIEPEIAWFSRGVN